MCLLVKNKETLCLPNTLETSKGGALIICMSAIKKTQYLEIGMICN